MCDAGIIPGDHVCCDVGTLPDFNPLSNADGICKHVLVSDRDICATLAKDVSEIITEQRYEFNGGSDEFYRKV